MFNFFSHSNIFSLLERGIKFINSIFFILLATGLTFALVLSPPDYLQGDLVRIMYIHVPSAWISLLTYSVIAFLSVLNFIFKIKIFHLINLAIITGSLWGQPTWGTWWVWDARLTSMFILMIFYILYIVSLKLSSISLKVSSTIAIIGAINIPIIKYSVEWWNTLHQPASIKLGAASSIHPTMMTPLMLMLLVLLLYCALIFLMKYKTEIIRIKKDKINKL